MPDPEQLRELARDLGNRLPEVSAQIRRRLREEVPGYTPDLDPALAVHESERIANAVRSFAAGITGGDEPSDEVLRAAETEARAAAQAGLDLNALIRTYRVAQSLLGDVVLEETFGGEASAARQLALQKEISGFQFRWNDTVVAAVVDAYQDEQRRFFHQARDRRLRAALRDLLAGRTDESPNGQYRLEGGHLAAVLWGEQRAQTVSELAAGLGARATLTVEGASGTTMAWFGFAPGAVPDPASADLALPAGTHVSLGKPGGGTSGFRTSHYQAWRAYRVGRLSHATVTRYADVALEALFLQDLQAARDLVAQQLGPLDFGDARTEVLCDTMRVYFGSGCNATKAAAQLQVHERTVAYRLRTVEERLGVEVVARRDELVVALRLLAALRAISAAESPVDPIVRL
ncbi:PucR family transcriptional regulator [Amycolatopsis sp. NPDC059090]|uniref:PucR family transcriptional regulator n=1 Tax=unclassified Amycolatopsis TaxID=2618356 RepID=UPI00366BB132